MVRLNFWRRAQRTRLNHEAIREREIKEAEVEAAANLRRLAERRKILEPRLEEARGNLAAIQEPEALRLAKLVYLWWLAPLFVGTVALAVASNLWGLEAFTALGLTKKLIVALSLPVLSLIGGAAIGTALRTPPGTPHRRTKFGVGFTILALAILGTVTINLVRGLDTARLEDHQRATVNATEDLDAENRGSLSNHESQPLGMAVYFTVASVAMGVAGELGAAYAFDQMLLLLVPVWTVARLRRRIHHLEEELVEIAVAEEKARHQTELVRALFAAEITEIEEVSREEEPEKEDQKSPEESLAPLAWKILFVILVLVGVVVGLVKYARGAEPLAAQTVVLVDLSNSASADDEFPRNLQAVEGLIKRIRDSGQRLVILGITQASFGEPSLLASTGPRETGRYGEHLEAWQKSLIGEWRRTGSRLTPSAKGSDLFGAIARSAIEFEESHAARKHLIILSDMRHVGRGFNFERVMGEPRLVVEQVQRQGFIPRLDGVQVWALGVHTSGVDEQQWGRLKAFWAEYVKRAGGELKAFTPNRVMNER